MPLADLRVEEEKATEALLEAQAARFQARHGGKAKEEIEAVDKQFREVQRREQAAESALEARTLQQ
jgi:hypothetical protein